MKIIKGKIVLADGATLESSIDDHGTTAVRRSATGKVEKVIVAPHDESQPITTINL